MTSEMLDALGKPGYGHNNLEHSLRVASRLVEDWLTTGADCHRGQLMTILWRSFGGALATTILCYKLA